MPWKDCSSCMSKLFAGAAADPNNQHLKGLLKRLEKKRDAGARFLQTQMVMDPKVLEHFCKEVDFVFFSM